ncbi:MAG: hypothetical protein IKC87_05130 [Clostridia bacterium]|nr:hypothetical protein [Clostridia bacterium]
MKKTISLVLAISILMLSLLALTACAGDGAPVGMKLIRGSDSIGYYIYGPEEWVIANQENYGIACSYVSKLDNSSVTLVEADMPEVAIPEYFAKELQSYPENFEVKPEAEIKECSFGNASKAYKAIFNYKYGSYEYRSMQIYSIFENRFYIFTYNAPLTSYDAETTYYDNYLEKVDAIITNVKFVSKADGEAPAQPEYEKDADGYRLVSNKAIAGFDLYLPDTYTVDWSTSMVSATRADGSNITLSEATSTQVTAEDYWKSRFEQLELIADDVKAVDGTKLGVDLGGNLDAASLEFTYKLCGKDYHVYQVLIVNGFKGYVFTFTAEEANFADLLEEAKTILYKTEF